jgi:hypothetical protein
MIWGPYLFVTFMATGAALAWMMMKSSKRPLLEEVPGPMAFLGVVEFLFWVALDKLAPFYLSVPLDRWNLPSLSADEHSRFPRWSWLIALAVPVMLSVALLSVAGLGYLK